MCVPAFCADWRVTTTRGVESCVHRITSRVRETEALLLVVVVASLLRVALLSKESLNSKGFLDIKLFTNRGPKQWRESVIANTYKVAYDSKKSL